MDGSAGGTRFLGAELRRGSMDLVLRDYTPVMVAIIESRATWSPRNSVDGWDVVFIFQKPSVHPRYVILSSDFERCRKAVSTVPRVQILMEGHAALVSLVQELLRVEFAERKDFP